MKKSSNKGFTLVELIIVIAILAIIMLIAIPNFSGIQQRMQVRADKQTAAQIGKAIRIWYAERVSEGLSVDTLYTLQTATTGTGASAVTKTTGKIFSGATEVTDGLCPYGKLAGISDYITPDNKPTSLSNTTGAKVDKQMYAPILTSQDRTAKILMVIQKADNSAVAADDSADTDATVAWVPAADVDITTFSADYDGTKAAIAYIEP